jgi:hypothetical protein
MIRAVIDTNCERSSDLKRASGIGPTGRPRSRVTRSDWNEAARARDPDERIVNLPALIRTS